MSIHGLNAVVSARHCLDVPMDRCSLEKLLVVEAKKWTVESDGWTDYWIYCSCGSDQGILF